MAKVIDIKTRQEIKARSGWDIDGLIGSMMAMFAAADDIAAEFAELVDADLMGAIQRLPAFVERTRALNKLPECLCGGPNQDWIMPIYNAVGEVYPRLDRELRETVLRGLIGYLDSLNSFYSQNHVALLREPLLLTDLMANRHQYWSGTEPGRYVLEKHLSVAALAALEEGQVGSIWVAMSVYWREGDTGRLPMLDVREWYYRSFADLVDRSLIYPAWAVTSSAIKRSGRGEGSFEECFDASLARNIDPRHHERVRQYATERPWLELNDGRGR